VYYITPAITLAGNYTYTDGSLNGADPKWNQVDIQAAYLLSKRTELYVQGEYQHVIESGLNIGAMINGLSEASANNNQVAVTAGIRHTF
jgi:GBP family porin